MATKIRNIEEKEMFILLDELINKDSVLFFDMDGTLIETDLANFLAYKKAIQTITGIEITKNINSKIRFNRTYLKQLLPNLNESDYNKIIKEKERIYINFISKTKLIEKVVNILFKYSKKNRTILVTNCRKDRAENLLKHFNLLIKFDKMYFRKINESGVKVNKFKNAINDIKIIEEKVIVFENERTEIEDAIKAGIPTQNIFII